MAKSGSEFKQNLDTIQKEVHRFLKPLGFQKKGRTHNRTTKGGLIHVINFQAGQFPLGQNYTIPGLRENFYGKFTINLGVMLPCVYQTERQSPVKDFVQEYHCTIRERLSSIAFGTDEWFDTINATNEKITALIGLFDRFALNFLDTFQTYDDVVAFYFKHETLPCQNAHRSALEIAIIAHFIGNHALSKQMFEKAHRTNHSGFASHVSKLAKRLGLDLLD